jgi:hypothetical protein
MYLLLIVVKIIIDYPNYIVKIFLKKCNEIGKNINFFKNFNKNNKPQVILGA